MWLQGSLTGWSGLLRQIEHSFSGLSSVKEQFVGIPLVEGSREDPGSITEQADDSLEVCGGYEASGGSWNSSKDVWESSRDSERTDSSRWAVKLKEYNVKIRKEKCIPKANSTIYV